MDNFRVFDLDDDGDDDLVALGGTFPGREDAAARPGFIVWNDTDGYRVEQLAGFAAFATRDFEFADFNGDGRTDIFLSAHGFDDEAAVGEPNFLFLQGDGGFANASDRLPPIIDFAHGADHGDIDGDGDLDILVNAQYGNNKTSPYFLINDGQGYFQLARDQMPDLAIGDETYAHQRFHWLGLADVNGDGLADMISGKERDFFNSTASHVFYNVGGRFSDTTRSDLPHHADFGANSVIVEILDVDLDGDGDLDIAMLSQRADPYGSGWGLQLLANDGAGNFSDVSSSFVEGPLSNPDGAWMVYLTARDLNDDGHIDLVVEGLSGGMVTLDTPLAWFGDGTGHFVPLRAGDFLGQDDGWLLGYSTFVRDGDTLKYVGLGAGDGRLDVHERGAIDLPQLPTSDRDDRIHASSSGATIDGRGGLDFFIISEARSDVGLERDGSEMTLAHQSSIQSVHNVERIAFIDGTLAFDFAGTAGQAYRVYQAAFDRVPDAAGLGYWIEAMDNGMDLLRVTGGFLDSAEFEARYGRDLSNTQFVEKLYENVLGRDGEPAGIAYWTGELEAGASRAHVLASIAQSNENITGVAPMIDDGIWYL
ncbi:DUF4214 domain-containing protein [Pararhizobium haloflavum]|uniref:DUF4214 domain-containing protein n=1 Tax=Pararhizobium haloflavum TaxID=2037914 RepID=UPI0018E44D46|nr:DUF4214 domain-containing protein [Pararhizobium haloflavum]